MKVLASFGVVLAVVAVLAVIPAVVPAVVWIIVAGYTHYGFWGACIAYVLTQICLHGVTHMLEGVTK